jgi:hypothetical protein
MSRDLRIEFRNNFVKHFQEKTLPKLEVFEGERKKRRFWLVFAVIAAIVLTAVLSWVLIYYNFDLSESIGEGVCLVYLLIWAPALYLCACSKKDFENKLKTKCLNSLIKAFGDDFWWGTKANIQEYTIENSRLFDRFDSISYDDNFTGTYKDVKVDISEVKMTRTEDIGEHERTVTVFDGLLVSFDMNKNFTGQTVIIRDRLLFGGSHQGLEKAAMEDPAFEKIYDVYSDDQIESRYLITPAFIERYMNIRSVFKTDDVKCSFNNNKILLAIGAGKDFFSIGSLWKPVTDTKQFQTLLEEFIAVLSLVDILKLNQRLGL